MKYRIVVLLTAWWLFAPVADAGDGSPWYHHQALTLAVGGGAVMALTLFLWSGDRRLEAARREARKNALRYRSLLDTATDGIHILDAQGKLLEASESFYRMLGYPKGTALHVADWDARWSPEELRGLVGGLIASPGIFETLHRRADGRIIEVEINAHGIEFDGMPRLYASSRDITPRKAAERALAESEARYRAQSERLAEVIWGTNIGTWEWNVMTGAMLFNPRWAEMIGQDLAALGRTSVETWRELAHPADRARAEAILARCFAGEVDTYDCEVRMKHRDGDWVWGLERGRVVEWSADGRAARMSGTRQDIAERKRAEEELEQHRQHLEDLVRLRTAELSASEARAKRIIEAAPDGLYGVDTQGRITFVNVAAGRMLGYAPEQAVGLSAHGLFHHGRADGTPCPEAECPVLDCLRTGATTRAEDETFRHADGHIIPVMYASHPLAQDGEVVGAVVSFVDLSARRAAEAAREQVLLAAENLAKTRREFLANMSHEIRTPLNGILGFARIGQQRCGDAAQTRDAFAKILESGQLLLGIINDILDFSKIEHGSLALESIPVDLLEALRETTDMVRDRAISKGLAVKVYKDPGVPRHCLGDPLRLRQVLTNLLANAVKFTERGSVALSIYLKGGELVFEIADTGIGMDAGQLARLFNPFEQADGSTTRKFGGTGLGLAISERLVSLMGGRILVESALGVGSTFRVVLPHVPAVADDGDAAFVGQGDEAMALPSLVGLRILVAEDNEINQSVIEYNLRACGARAVLVGTGKEAVERVCADGPETYDLVLMDIQMPEMDGYEATRRILELAPDLPIVGQTAHAFKEDREKCYASGMVAHIAKPIDPVELAELIRRHARKGRGRRILAAMGGAGRFASG